MHLINREITASLFRYFTCFQERFCYFQALLAVPAAVTCGIVLPGVNWQGKVSTHLTLGEL